MAHVVFWITKDVGDLLYYFNPYDVEDMARAIEKIVNDEQLREELIKKGLEQAKKYSWQETARKTLEVYRELSS